MKILIDAGHRNNVNDYGATGNGQKESAMALSISKKLQKELEKRNVVVYMSRESENDTITIDQRYRKANALKVDLLLSVHINSASNMSASGIEVLYKHKKDLARELTNAMCAATGARNRGAKYRDDLGVLNGYTNSVLLECGFISNAEECRKLNDAQYQDKIVKAVVDTIVKEYKLTVDVADTDLINAIDKIIASGVYLDATSWNTVTNIKLSNVSALLSKLGGVDKLVKQGVIGNTELWTSGKYTVLHVRSLLIKYSERLG